MSSSCKLVPGTLSTPPEISMQAAQACGAAGVMVREAGPTCSCCDLNWLTFSRICSLSCGGALLLR